MTLKINQITWGILKNNDSYRIGGPSGFKGSSDSQPTVLVYRNNSICFLSLWKIFACCCCFDHSIKALTHTVQSGGIRWTRVTDTTTGQLFLPLVEKKKNLTAPDWWWPIGLANFRHAIDHVRNDVGYLHEKTPKVETARFLPPTAGLVRPSSMADIRQPWGEF